MGRSSRTPAAGKAVVACVAALASSGCYGALGPTIGVALDNGRATAGFELSAATLTVAHSFAFKRPSTPDPGSRAWRHRTSILWEPSIGTVVGDSKKAFQFVGMGPTLGMRWDGLDDGSSDFGFSGGVWVSGGTALSRGEQGCSDEVRPYATLILGIRGDELYLSPKVGIVDVPRFCISLGSFGF